MIILADMQQTGHECCQAAIAVVRARAGATGNPPRRAADSSACAAKDSHVNRSS